MNSKVVCDGSTVEWEPVLVDNECCECGQGTGQSDTAEPSFHGNYRKRGDDLICARCKQVMPDLLKTTLLLQKKVKDHILSVMERPSVMAIHLRGKRLVGR
jgi:hypothetical protein